MAVISRAHGHQIVREEAAKSGHVDIGESYIQEAEHTDGNRYWVNNFTGPTCEEDLRIDYALYQENVLEVRDESGQDH